MEGWVLQDTCYKWVVSQKLKKKKVITSMPKITVCSFDVLGVGSDCLSLLSASHGEFERDYLTAGLAGSKWVIILPPVQSFLNRHS